MESITRKIMNVSHVNQDKIECCGMGLAPSRYRKLNRKITKLLDVANQLVSAKKELTTCNLRRLNEYKKARKIMRSYSRSRQKKPKWFCESEILPTGVKLKIQKSIPQVYLDPNTPTLIKICFSKQLNHPVDQPLIGFGSLIHNDSTSQGRVSRSKSSDSSRPSTAEPVQIENEKLDGDGNAIDTKLTHNVSDEILAADDDSRETMTPSYLIPEFLEILEKRGEIKHSQDPRKLSDEKGRKRTRSESDSDQTLKPLQGENEIKIPENFEQPVSKKGRSSRTQQLPSEIIVFGGSANNKITSAVPSKPTEKDNGVLSRKTRGRPKKSVESPEHCRDESDVSENKHERTSRKKRSATDAINSLSFLQSKTIKDNLLDSEEQNKLSVGKIEETQDSSLRKESLKIVIGCDKKAGKEKAFILKPNISPQGEADKDGNDPKYTVQSSGENPLKLKLKSGKNDPFKEEPKERLKLKLSFKTCDGKPVIDVIDEKSQSRKKEKSKHSTDNDNLEKLKPFNVKIKSLHSPKAETASTNEMSCSSKSITKTSVSKSPIFNQELSVHLHAFGNFNDANKDRNLTESKFQPVAFSPEKKLFSVDSKDDEDDEDIGLSKGTFNDLVRQL